MQIIKALIVFLAILINAQAGMFGNMFGDPNKLSKPIKVSLSEDPNIGQTAIITRLFDNLKKDKVTMKLKDKSGKTINVSANELKLVNFDQNTTYPILDIAFPENVAFSDENVIIAINVLQPQFDKMALEGYSRFLRIKCKTYDDNRSVMYIENAYGHVYLDTNNIKTALESIGCVMTDTKNADVNLSIGIKNVGSSDDWRAFFNAKKTGATPTFKYIDRNSTAKGSYIDDKGHAMNFGSAAAGISGNSAAANSTRSTLVGLGLLEIVLDSALKANEKKKPEVLTDSDFIGVLVFGLSQDNYSNDEDLKRTCDFAIKHMNKTCDEVMRDMKSEKPKLMMKHSKDRKLYGYVDEKLQEALIKEEFIPQIAKALKKKFQLAD